VGALIAPAGVLRIAAPLAVALVLLLAALTGILAVTVSSGTCTGGDEARPSAAADRDIPAGSLIAYREAGSRYEIPWPVLAAIGAIEADHGRSTAPGVRAGLDSYGCCAGPMQFNLTDGPPSTWQRYRVDGDRDGTEDVYDLDDAIASAANYLRTLLRNADGDIRQAVYGYNHSTAYVNDVLARTRLQRRGERRPRSAARAAWTHPPGRPTSAAAAA
jgi:membrane-bound lytic murein transglycosylase B